MKASVYILSFFLLILAPTTSKANLRYESDTTSTSDSTQRKPIVQKEGGSANRGKAYFFMESMKNAGIPDLQFIDTIGQYFFRYNPILSDNIFRTHRGNIGQITQNIEYEYDSDVLFSYGKDPFSLYRFTPTNTPFYQVGDPYTELRYVLGAGKEQSFRAMHSQNVWKGLNLGMDFRVIHSPGQFDRNFNKHINFRAFGNFISLNQRYRAVAGYYLNKLAANENGGILMPDDSLKYLPSNKEIAPIRLQQAENLWKEHRFYLKQSYLVGAKMVDTMPYAGLKFGYISHSLYIDRYSSEFNDRALSVDNYPFIYRDSTQTHDSIFVHEIHNNVMWSFGDVTNWQIENKFNLCIGLEHEMGFVYNDSLGKHNFSQLLPYADVRLKILEKWHLAAGAKVVIAGDNYQDIHAYGKMAWDFGKKYPSRLLFGFDYNRLAASDFESHYFSNHYFWENDFDPSHKFHLHANLSIAGIDLKAEHTLFNQYIYLAEEGFKQADESFSLLKISAEKNFKFGIFAIDNRIVFQQLSNDKHMHLPKLLTRNALYLDFIFFKVSPLQIGFDVQYNTSYYADAYNPALASFYYQDQVKTGNFVFIDAFLQLTIKRANLFVKVENLTAGWLGNNFVMTSRYPVSQRQFKFGVLWRFYD